MAGGVSGSLRLPVGKSWLESASSIMSRVAGCARHAAAGERAFSRAGVVRKLAVYGTAFLAGFVPGWAFLYGDEQWMRDRFIQFCVAGLFSGFAMWWFLGRFEDRGGRPGFWCLALTMPMMPCWGVMFGAMTGESPGVMRWVFVSVAVLVVAGVTWLRFVSDRVRNRVAAWAAAASSCVVPSWMLCLLFGGSPLSCLPWCMAVGAVGALWFLQDLWAIDYCAGDNRDAAFEWLAAWALIFDLMTLVAALARGSSAAQGQ
ncbi:hypothetical protein GYM67_02315 [Bifidobacterium asteroides]|uniref:hypothetical protein n=1 Tax=Bifidobacterium asteroides TaxID=1684 RepID=UPI001C695A7C|nr:hypothetical protein [Bifidobacterium asteroides]QYN60038.1 hypothetical protein GYM67_02315 [Bifidobacterium asteroides]